MMNTADQCKKVLMEVVFKFGNIKNSNVNQNWEHNIASCKLHLLTTSAIHTKNLKYIIYSPWGNEIIGLFGNLVILI